MSPKKQWSIKTKYAGHESEIDAISTALGFQRATSALLWGRGYKTPVEAERFIKKETVMFHDQFLLSGMNEGCERIEHAIDSNEKIVIYGDYDVDGVTSVSTLCLYLRSRGATVDFYIPNRIGEGYGINTAALETLAEQGYTLMITVDTGITAAEETDYARSLGIDVIVTDHHECHDRLPNAVAVINPRRPDCEYPFKELAGVGVVFKLICALEARAAKSRGEEGWDYMRTLCEKYADLVAIGTVADVMPLIDENRLIVSIGLKMIEKTSRKGLSALIEMSSSGGDAKSGRIPKKRKITSSFIGYTIAPRINAAGRISNASRAVELFLTESDSEAQAISEELCNTNRQRQIEENSIIEDAYKKISAEFDFEHDKIIVLADDNWHHGVIGIVSSRITERYNLPSILISFEGDIGKGSGRSVKGINLVEALKECSDLLIKFGGHELAAGLSIERDKLPEFTRRINDYAREHLHDEDIITSIDVDMELSMQEITLPLASELYYLEPYGIANPVPTFALRGAVITEMTAIGAGKHTKFTLEKDGKSVTALYFGKSPAMLEFCCGDEVDAVFNLDINEFQNQKTVQIILRDMELGKAAKECLARERAEYRAICESIKDGKKFALDESVIPNHDDFTAVYLTIKQEIRQGNDTLGMHAMQRTLSVRGRELSYVKLMLIIDIFNETKVLGIERRQVAGEVDVYSFKLNYINTKVNLEKSSIFKRLKNRQEKG